MGGRRNEPRTEVATGISVRCRQSIVEGINDKKERRRRHRTEKHNKRRESNVQCVKEKRTGKAVLVHGTTALRTVNGKTITWV